MPVKKLTWSEPAPPKKGKPSWYDHVFADTPFGRIMIEWKSWKDDDDYDVSFPWEEKMELPSGDVWVNCHAIGFTLDDAKRVAQEEFAKRVGECLAAVDAEHDAAKICPMCGSPTKEKLPAFLSTKGRVM